MSWQRTREGYKQRAKAALEQPHGRATVAVLAKDLEYMLQELDELDLVRGVVAMRDAGVTRADGNRPISCAYCNRPMFGDGCCSCGLRTP